MIIGECPYCDQIVTTECAEVCPAFSKETCPHCGKEYWLKHSRIDPKAYLLENVKVDEETKQILEIVE